ncbi:MAG: hypothetical protein A2015_04970 [Spirochaetes bacterium GWF1_31_7]|nr:MAG: hypothetical protein A2Y30_05340 [Spirochaetes bacterium GWE1_32_154]OHD48815.1 MAG: hypothetical protein A2Y29_03320 [Spirochaetes bacterium GWE2_31_10]OHD52877.1 MAG: hypothetical protein A2015_04970 [Spirochaetes bacterium GWF1_31_7]OHD80786.1 MAG: hypothetical protein A2355_16605 [Spirochaetes bacterium RIFOXYB1_FULL_32_8]HBD94668.1 hypothetical protein [Spirochaetia bacterium]
MSKYIYLFCIITFSVFILWNCGEPSASDDFNKKYPVSSIDEIVVRNVKGTITVMDNTGDATNISISAKKTGWSKFDLDRIIINADMSGDTVLLVETTHPNDVNDVFVNYEIKIPSTGFSVSVKNTEGNVTLKDFETLKSAEVENGNVSISKIKTGELIQVKNGSISALDSDSLKKIYVETGSVALSKIKSAQLIQVKNGNVSVSNSDYLKTISVETGNISAYISELTDDIALTTKTGVINAYIELTDYKSIILKAEDGVTVSNKKNISLTGSGTYSINLSVTEGSIILDNSSDTTSDAP